MLTRKKDKPKQRTFKTFAELREIQKRRKDSLKAYEQLVKDSPEGIQQIPHKKG